jgi:uncharacterized protein YaaN involved in tellurite resistance
MSEIKLTLGNIPAAPDASAVAAAAAEKPVEKPAQPVFTPEEQKMIDDFSKQIDITNSALVFQYGAGTQQNIANFSDSALASVRSKDLGEVGDMISSLVVELRDFTADEEESRGFFGFLKKKVDKLQLLKARYDEAEVNVNKIVSELENHQVQLLKDIATLDQLYELNLSYFKELSMYIAAGKQSLEAFRAGELTEARAKAQASGLPEILKSGNCSFSICPGNDDQLIIQYVSSCSLYQESALFQSVHLFLGCAEKDITCIAVLNLLHQRS